MTLLIRARLRRMGAVWVAAVTLAGSIPSAFAANTNDDPARQAQPVGGDNAKPPRTGEDPGEPPAPAPVPQLQIQDEGPSSTDGDVARVSRRRIPVAEDTEERPFWKHWAFWAVTGALVAGAVGMVIYTTSGSNSSLAPCPPDVVVSLGCFGSGRGP